MKKLAVVALATIMAPATASAATIFGVDENNNLVTFDSANPSTFTGTVPITNTTATLLALDFRDSNGLLYGLSGDKRLWTVDVMTGVASEVGGDLALTGTNFGFDFNTVVDAIRVVGNLDDNYVVNADTGTIAGQFTDVAYGAGDPNLGADAVVTGNAYIHGTATQYAIDTNLNNLVTQANNDGTLATVGSLGVMVGPRTSFDIGYGGTAFLQDERGFYTVNLATGMASLVGETSTSLFGITAARDNVGAIPEPATWGMLLLGFGFIGSVVRRKRRVNTNVAYT